MSLEWREFPSIDPETKLLEALNTRRDEDGWCVQEKIHGCQTCFHVDANGTLLAAYSRRQKLDLNKPGAFHNFPVAVDRAIPLMVDFLKEHELPDALFYGELFGNYFPGAKETDGSASQKEIVYSPLLRFRVYKVVAAIGKISIPDEGDLFVRTEFKGTLAECFEYATSNLQRISQYADGPSDANQYIEGFVLKNGREAFKWRAGEFRPDGPKILQGDKIGKVINRPFWRNFYSKYSWGENGEVTMEQLEARLDDACKELGGKWRKQDVLEGLKRRAFET